MTYVSEHERVWYSHRTTGDRAFLVNEDGKERIRLDRPTMAHELSTRDFHADEWIPLHDVRPLTDHQMAQVALEADRKLCFFLSLHGLAGRSWLSMKDEERIAWTAKGPPTALRKRVFEAIMAALREGAP